MPRMLLHSPTAPPGDWQWEPDPHCAPVGKGTDHIHVPASEQDTGWSPMVLNHTQRSGAICATSLLIPETEGGWAGCPVAPSIPIIRKIFLVPQLEIPASCPKPWISVFWSFLFFYNIKKKKKNLSLRQHFPFNPICLLGFETSPCYRVMYLFPHNKITSERSSNKVKTPLKLSAL